MSIQLNVPIIKDINHVLQLITYNPCHTLNVIAQLRYIKAQLVIMLFQTKEIYPKRKEYILEGNLLEKSVKRPFYCFHTAGVLHLFMLYNLLGPGISFYRKSKINIKR